MNLMDLAKFDFEKATEITAKKKKVSGRVKLDNLVSIGKHSVGIGAGVRKKLGIKETDYFVQIFKDGDQVVIKAAESEPEFGDWKRVRARKRPNNITGNESSFLSNIKCAEVFRVVNKKYRPIIDEAGKMLIFDLKEWK